MCSLEATLPAIRVTKRSPKPWSKRISRVLGSLHSQRTRRTASVGLRVLELDQYPDGMPWICRLQIADCPPSAFLELLPALWGIPELWLAAIFRHGTTNSRTSQQRQMLSPALPEGQTSPRWHVVTVNYNTIMGDQARHIFPLE